MHNEDSKSKQKVDQMTDKANGITFYITPGFVRDPVDIDRILSTYGCM